MKKRQPDQIIFIDPNDCKTYSLTGNILSLEENHKYNKKNIYISYVNSTDLTKSTLEIDKEVPEDEVGDIILERVYEELKLDPDIPILLRYEQRGMNFDGSKIEYNAYILDEQTITTDFAKCIDQYPYIDYIIPTPFLFAGLYGANVVPKEGAHAYCYFGKRDSIFMLFEDGKLLYYRTLQNNLAKMFAYFNDVAYEAVSETTFIKLLNGQATDFNHEKALMKLYDDICMSLEEILIYVKRIYSISNLDKLFIDSSFGINDKFYEFASDYLTSTSQSFQFDYGFQRNDTITQIGMLALLSAREYKRGMEAEFNYTLFEKPKPFHKRDAGIMLMLTAASFVLAFAYPAYNYFNITLLENANQELNKQSRQIQQQANQLRNEITSLEQERKDTLERLAFSQKETERQFRILQDIYNRQNNYATKTDMMIELIQDISKTGVTLEVFTTEDYENMRNVQLHVNSKKHDNLTELIQMLERNQKFDVHVDEIKQDENATSYMTSIGLVLR